MRAMTLAEFAAFMDGFAMLHGAKDDTETPSRDAYLAWLAAD